MINSKSLEHSIFQWDINNFLFCLAEPSYFFVSPVYDLVYSSSKWYLEIYVNKVGNSENTILKLSVRLCRTMTDEGPTEIKVRFSLTLFSTDGTVFLEANNNLCTFKRSNICGIDFDEKADTVTTHLKSNKQLIVSCQIFATADTSETFDFKQTNLYTLSQDLSWLIFSNEIPKNASLISEGDEIPVHKEILCARSPVFLDLFSRGRSQIHMPYSKEVVLAMLIFLYSGDVGMMASNSPPPIELCHLAYEYQILDLQSVLCLQKAQASTTIQVSGDTYKWDIPNFTAKCCSTEVTDSGIFEIERVLVKITLLCDTDDKLGKLKFFVQLWNLLQIRGCIIDMYILDAAKNIRFTKSNILSPKITGTDSCDFIIEEEHLFGREHIILPHDTLFTYFSFNFNTGLGEISSLPVITVERTDSSGTFESHSLSYQLKDLFLTNLFADVNIRVGNMNIPVHKSILSARSLVFRDIFRKSQTYEATGLSASVIQQLLYYIYTGYIYTADTLLLIELYESAEFFSVPQLKAVCYKLLSECRITATNVCALLRFSSRFNLHTLKSRCVDDICRNADVVFDKPSWANLKSENPKLCAEILDMVLHKTH